MIFKYYKINGLLNYINLDILILYPGITKERVISCTELECWPYELHFDCLISYVHLQIINPFLAAHIQGQQSLFVFINGFIGN